MTGRGLHVVLLASTGRGDSVGDLARDYVDGVASGAHELAESVGDMVVILERFRAAPEVFEALDSLWTER